MRPPEQRRGATGHHPDDAATTLRAATKPTDQHPNRSAADRHEHPPDPHGTQRITATCYRCPWRRTGAFTDDAARAIGGRIGQHIEANDGHRVRVAFTNDDFPDPPHVFTIARPSPARELAWVEARRTVPE